MRVYLSRLTPDQLIFLITLSIANYSTCCVCVCMHHQEDFTVYSKTIHIYYNLLFSLIVFVEDHWRFQLFFESCFSLNLLIYGMCTIYIVVIIKTETQCSNNLPLFDDDNYEFINKIKIRILPLNSFSPFGINKKIGEL